jgi:hypothetical protein
MRSISRSLRPFVLLPALLAGLGACRPRSSDRADAQPSGAADAAPDAAPEAVRRRIVRARVDAAPEPEDAGAGPAAPAPRDGGGDGAPCPTTFGRYNRTQLDAIVRRRADGEGLAEIAKVVGGTRDEVKAAEAAELARRKALKTLRGRTGGDPCVE